jgi:cation transport ATPase
MTARTTQRQTLELLNFSDRHAWVEREGEKQQISLTDVYKGDKVIVHPGELIPVDGRILHGVALIDEQNVTGDARPVTCLEGQEVYASTLLLKGQISVLAERTGKDTRAALVAQFLKTVPVADTQAGDKVGAVSDELIVPTLFLSSSLFSLTGNVAPALAPLQFDFGTGIGIAIPTTILAALTDAARSGVFIRNGRALESLARIDTIVFGNPLPQASANAIEILTAQGLEIYLLGDRQQQEVIRTLHENGKVVAYVGSSSDAEVFADADLSISFAEETDLERETADVVVLIGDDMWGLIHAIDIAKRAMEIVYQNIAIVAVPNISVVIAGIFFGLHPIAAVIVNNFAALIAELNGLRPLLGTIGPLRALNPGKAPQKQVSSILTGSNC